MTDTSVEKESGSNGKVGRGRPRRAGIEEDVTRATLELLAEGSYSELSMEMIAERAGVGKPTLYRRWASKGALVTDVIRQVAEPVSIPEGSDIQSGLRRVFVETYRKLVNTGLIHAYHSLLGETGNPEFAALFREQYIRPRQELILEALKRGVADGELRSDLEPSLMFHILAGPFTQGTWDGKVLTSKQMTTLFDEVWASVSSEGRRSRRQTPARKPQ